MLRKATFLLALALALVVVLPTLAGSPDTSRAERMAAKAADAANSPRFDGTLPSGIQTQPSMEAEPPSKATMGTIVYDDGVFNSVPSQPAISGDILSFGNQFNTFSGNPIPAPTITVTQIAVWPALVDGSSTASGAAFVTIFGPVNTAGTNAAPISSNNYGSITPGTWNTFPVANTGTVSPAAGPGTRDSFLVGMWAGSAGASGDPCVTDCIGLSTGSVAGQGFHGMHVDDFSGGDFGMIAGSNALLRVSGNVVPVELMTFDVE